MLTGSQIIAVNKLDRDLKKAGGAGLREPELSKRLEKAIKLVEEMTAEELEQEFIKYGYTPTRL